MTADDPSPKKRSTILSAEPQLFVTDLPAALEFYAEMLGFTVVFSYGAPAFYAQLRRDGARLNLRAVTTPVFADGFRAKERDALSVTMTLDDIDALVLELKHKGTDFYQPLKSEPWGARTFIVQDPSGNLICFSGPPTEAG